jgi:ribosomal protein L24E
MKQIISISVLALLLAARVSTASVQTGVPPPETKAAVAAPGGPGVRHESVPLAKKSHRVDALNNVVAMDEDGSRSALCVCGRTFRVTGETATTNSGGTTLYLCSDKCAELARKGGPDWDAAVTSWQKAFSSAKLLTNAHMKKGREIARCTCGKVFDVNWKTLAVAENGLVVHFCSAACDRRFQAEGQDERIQTELAMIPAAKAEPYPSVEVIYHGAGGTWTAGNTIH